MKDAWSEVYLSDWRTRATGADASTHGVVIYTYPVGWKRRVRANRPVRNNNPGNLRFSSDRKAREAGALTRDEEGFGVFPDWVTGKRAADDLWHSMRDDRRRYTISTAVERFTETDREKRIADLLDKARGWMDRDGKPVIENTPLSKLTDEQFIALRNYNNMQLEGWLNGLYEFSNPEVATSGWIQTPADAHAPAAASTRQPPAGNAPSPAGPVRPHSSLEAPQPTNPVAYAAMETPGQAQPMAGQNKFLSPHMSWEGPTPSSRPFAQYGGTGFSPSAENPYGPGLGTPARPNLLTSPPSLDSFSFGTGTPPQANPQPSGQRKRKAIVPDGQVKKAPFYSLKDRLDFLGRVYRFAKPVSEATGLSLPFILAHTAHEVDFGKNIGGNNLFNLKAGKDWEGPTHTKKNGTYRSYPSYEESMKDYLAYLQANPRYGKMFEPVTRTSLERLADAIHYAGYSDNPLYGVRILAAAKDPIMKRALWQYEHWPPGEGN